MTPDSRCSVEVELEWVDGARFQGMGEGNATPEGHMRAGAAATIQATTKVATEALALELRGTKCVRAFDKLLVIVAIRGQGPDRRYDLIGTTVAPEGDLIRGAALAVLDATNRILDRYAAQKSA